MDRHHVRVSNRAAGWASRAESVLEVLVLRQIRWQDFDGHEPIGDGDMGSPHLAHAAAT